MPTEFAVPHERIPPKRRFTYGLNGTISQKMGTFITTVENLKFYIIHIAYLLLHKLTVAYRLLVGKHEGRKPLGRPRRRWLYNIRMDLVEVGWGDVD
jgi:hypothetical protein